jgi:hypothetical protein
LIDMPLTVFTAFARTAASWPGCPILLCAPDQPLRADLDRLAIDRALPIHPDRCSALDAARMLPPPRRYVQPLPAGTGACTLARRVVDAACREWRLPHVNENAALVVTELVSNALRHGGGDLELQVRLGRFFLHLAARDGSPHRPRRVGGSAAPRGGDRVDQDQAPSAVVVLRVDVDALASRKVTSAKSNTRRWIRDSP